MNAITLLRRLKHELGGVGLASIAMLALAMLFLLVALKPLEKRNQALEHELASNARARAPADDASTRTSTPAAKIAAFYHFLESGKQATDWLDRLHTAAREAGIELRSADYRMLATGTRIDRYEIRIPMRASYAQVRGFLDGALAEIPMLSLDEVKFKRERASDSAVEAELHLTLHLVNS